jgi:Domain of unknown function (DUF4149)
MIRAARALYLTSLGLWVGGMSTLAFIVAPTLFRLARPEAGMVFGSILRSFGLLQMVLALTALAAVVVLHATGTIRPKTGYVRLGILLLMLLLVCGSQFIIGPAIERERAAVPNFDSVPAGVPARARFDALHRWSVRVAGLTLLLGAGLLIVSTAASEVKPSDGA